MRILVSRARSVNSLVLHVDLVAKEFVLAFEAFDVAIVGAANGRVYP